MKLTDKQQDILYIVIAVIVGILLGLSVYFIIKHIRSKKCDDDNQCPTGKTCKNKKCVDDGNKCSCDGKNCGDDNGCGTACDGPCPTGQTCQNKTCVDDRNKCSCDGKKCGKDNGCGTKCNVLCDNGATCKPDSSEPCKIEPKPNPIKTCTENTKDPYESGTCKPCCDGMQMYQIDGKPPRFICSSIKPDNLTKGNPYKNTCPPEKLAPTSNRTKINYTWNDGFDTLESGKNMLVDDDWDFFDHNGEKVFRFGIDKTSIKGGSVDCGSFTNKIRIDKLIPDKKYNISDTNAKVNFVLLSPQETKGEIYGFANCVYGPRGLVAEYKINKGSGGGGSGGGGSGGGGSGGGGSGGWENARKCSDVGITKASACGNQKYVCAHSDKNKTPDCNSNPFKCSNGRTKCLNE